MLDALYATGVSKRAGFRFRTLAEKIRKVAPVIVQKIQRLALNHRTFPELTDDDLNSLTACHARLADLEPGNEPVAASKYLHFWR